MADVPRSRRSGAAQVIKLLVRTLQFAGRAGFYSYIEQVCGPTFVVLLKAALDAISVLNEADDFFAQVDSTTGEPWDGSGVPALLQMNEESPLEAAQRFVHAAAMSRGYN